MIEALSSPGVAAGLWSLGLSHPESISQAINQISAATERGSWANLSELRIQGLLTQSLLQRLMEALRVGASDLRSLVLEGCSDGAAAEAVAEGLRYGACPQLEELNLSHGRIGDVGMMELARAMEGGAPCNTTLRRLRLGSCGVGREGVKELAAAMAQGALPNLDHLSLSHNYYCGDEGVAYLAEAMRGGGLQRLRELDLSCVGMGSVGVMVLSQALIDHHACPQLVKLSLKDVGGPSNRSQVDLIEGLRARRGAGKVKQ